MALPKRKPTRLREYDYSTPGAYFITICTKDRKELLSSITTHGTDGITSFAENRLSAYGMVCEKYINNINTKYENVTVDKYVIMPNHIHLIILLHGTMRTLSPAQNIENIIRSLKTLITKEAKIPIWQRSYHDHIIRGEKDYNKIWEYIDTNVIKWHTDCFYNN